MMRTHALALLATCSLLGLSLTGCATADRLAEVGRPPAMTKIGDVRAASDPDKIIYPVGIEATVKPTSNSLWRLGSKTFLEDQRAARVGDVVTVSIAISENATLANDLSRKRTNDDSLNLGSLGGYASKLGSILPGHPKVDPTELLGSSGSANLTTSGSASRSEDINLSVAAVVVDRLTNGNFVISGKQEVRVNNELRDVRVAGIVRPQDIDSNNAVAYDKIAEARISYGGRGVLSDYQQPPIGAEILEVIRPF